MTGLFKLMYVAAAVGASTYSMSVFGTGMWSLVFLGIAALVLASLFVPKLDALANILGRISGVLSGMALVVLLVAATVGGAFRMSENNVVFAYLLALLCFLGLAAFFWTDRLRIKSSDTSPDAAAPDEPPA